MSKKDFIEAYASKTRETKKRAEELVNDFLNLVEENLLEGNDVQFVGWGTFSVNEKQAREGRNPQNGEKIEIPAKRVVKFKVGKKLADKVSSK